MTSSTGSMPVGPTVTDARAFVVAVAAALVVATATGCSGEGVDAVPERARSGVQTLAAQGTDLSDAVELLTERCMKKHGKPYYPNLGAGGASVGGVVGMLTVEEARAYGYGPAVSGDVRIDRQVSTSGFDIEHPHSLIIGITAAQPVKDLLWRPLLRHTRGDLVMERLVCHQETILRPARLAP